MPEGIQELTRAARRVKPDAVVWKGGDPELPHVQQGLKVLGTLASPRKDDLDNSESGSHDKTKNTN